MNNLVLKNKLDKQLEQEYLTSFNITNPAEYQYYAPKENELRMQSYIEFFISKKESIKCKKNKNINDFLLMKLCNEKIEALLIKLNLMKELSLSRKSKKIDFTEINKKLGMIGHVPEIQKIDESLKNVWKTQPNISNKFKLV